MPDLGIKIKDNTVLARDEISVEKIKYPDAFTPLNKAWNRLQIKLKKSNGRYFLENK